MMPPKRSIIARLIWYVVFSVGFGVLGGLAGAYLTAPFYFGFFLGFVLVGLICLFELAVFIENWRNKK